MRYPELGYSWENNTFGQFGRTSASLYLTLKKEKGERGGERKVFGNMSYKKTDKLYCDGGFVQLR